MSTLKSNTIEPATGTELTLGASGDTMDVLSDALQVNTWKDSGGNTLFTSDGAGTLSSVNSALDIGGGPTLISTATASTSASLSFTTGIDDTYDKYMFVIVNVQPTTDSAFFQFQVSTNGGTSYGARITSTNFCATHGENGTNGRIEYVTAGDLANSTSYQPLGLYIGSDTDECFSAELFIVNPAGTTFIKQFYSTGNLVSSSIYTRNPFVAGYVNTASRVSAIDFKFSTGNIAAGKVKMYGCR